MLSLKMNEKNWQKVCNWIAFSRAREVRTNARMLVLLEMLNKLLKEKGWPTLTMDDIDKATGNDEESIIARAAEDFDLPDDIFPHNPS